MQINLVSKGGSDNTCPYCRDTIQRGEGRRCRGCRTTLHRECAEELHKCPTVGCGRSLSRSYSSARVRVGPARAADGPSAELTEGQKKAIGALVGICLVVGVFAGGFSKAKNKHDRRARATHRHSGALRKLTLGVDVVALREEIPKLNITAGQPFQLALHVEELRGPVQLVIRPGTIFRSPSPRYSDCLILHQTELLIRRTGSYEFRVLALEPSQWKQRPEGHLRAELPTTGPELELAQRFHAKRLQASHEIEAVAGLFYLGHSVRTLKPPPSRSVAEAAARLVKQIGGSPQPQRSPTVSADALLRRLRFDPRRSVSRLDWRLLAKVRDDARVIALARRYLESEHVEVRDRALRWLETNGPRVRDTLDLRQQLITGGRTERLLALRTLVKRHDVAYAPLQYIYARDAHLGKRFYEAFLKELPQARAAVEERGASPYRLWVRLKGWDTLSLPPAKRRRLQAVARTLERSEDEYVARLLRHIDPQTNRRTDGRLARDVSRLAKRFPHHPTLWKHLEALASDRSRWVRSLAFNAINRLPHGDRILIRLINDRTAGWTTRREAVSAARYLELRQAVPVWAAACQNPPALALACFPLIERSKRALAEHTDQGIAVRELLEGLARTSSEKRVAEEALTLIFKLHLPGTIGVLQRLSKHRPAHGVLAIRLAAQHMQGPPDLARLVSGELRLMARTAPSPTIRASAVHAAATFGRSPKLLATLSDVMRRELNAGVRAAAVVAALRRTDEQPVPEAYLQLALGGLKDREGRVQRAAIQALAKHQGSAVRSALRAAALDDASRGVRLSAYRALLHRDREQARHVLSAWLKKTDVRDQRMAVEGLIRDFGSTRWAKGKLTSVRRHRDRAIRRQVAEYLAKN